MKRIDECGSMAVLVALLVVGILLVMGAYRIFSYLCENAALDARPGFPRAIFRSRPRAFCS